MTRPRISLTAFTAAVVHCVLCATAWPQPVDIGSRRELFVDAYLIDKMKGARLKLHTPQYAPPCEKPLPRIGMGGSYAYGTVFRDGDIFRFYGRRERLHTSKLRTREQKLFNQVTVYAHSADGVNWIEPNLGLYKDVPEVKTGNVVLAWEFGTTHNFTPFVDARPGVPEAERYKGIGGMRTPRDAELAAKYGPGGLRAYVSADALRWKRMRDQPVIPNEWGAFDSQNVAFWSETEQCYVCYFRVFDNKHSPGVRSVRRSTSRDFVHWTKPVDLRINLPREQLYVNNIKPYARAPHIYVGLPTRINFDHGAATEVMFTASRDGVRFDRRFRRVFLRPGVRVDGRYRYGNRGNYAAHHVIQTGPKELSIYTYDGRRFVLRLDGFASLNAPFAGGEMVTRPLTFAGRRLTINARTAGIGYVRVGIQDAAGRAVPGYALADAEPFTGDNVVHVCTWKGKADLSALAGRPVRLRFVLKDADVYSLRFVPAASVRPRAQTPLGRRAGGV